ncbi:hypothetical protein C1646_683744 [Rhizophagus diaphanus]|nr:hypothetical protein C1646_683744 [Rhizophagus diaphanus] [Rhizophagus sp. MUCL 43196]
MSLKEFISLMDKMIIRIWNLILQVLMDHIIIYMVFIIITNQSFIFLNLIPRIGQMVISLYQIYQDVSHQK